MAAIKIQKVFRGYRIRKQYNQILLEKLIRVRLCKMMRVFRNKMRYSQSNRGG